jgi:hypothetical protein
MIRKNNRTVTTIILSVLIIIVSVISYYQFIRPVYLNNQNQEATINFSRSEVVGFGKYEDQDKIFGIEIEIKGETASNFELAISNGEQQVHSAKIKGGTVDFIYKNDWYADSCFLLVTPLGEAVGTLHVDLRFLALD